MGQRTPDWLTLCLYTDTEYGHGYNWENLEENGDKLLGLLMLYSKSWPRKNERDWVHDLGYLQLTHSFKTCLLISRLPLPRIFTVPWGSEEENHDFCPPGIHDILGKTDWKADNHSASAKFPDGLIPRGPCLCGRGELPLALGSWRWRQMEGWDKSRKASWRKGVLGSVFKED